MTRDLFVRTAIAVLSPILMLLCLVLVMLEFALAGPIKSPWGGL